MNKKLAIIGGSIIGAILLVAIVIFSVNQVQQMQERNAKAAAHEKAVAVQAKAAKAEKQKKKDFSGAYDLFVGFATTTAQDAEEIGGKYHDVWQKTIFDDSVTIKGKRYTDFNDSIQAQYDVFEANGKNKDAKEAFDSMKVQFDIMTDSLTLANQAKYDDAKKLYDLVSKFYNLSIDPSGTLQSYTEDFNQYDNDVASQLQTLQN
ncbi:hypothetical protein ACFP7A_00735 [Sporolactobacillus kofuensis]|uniref:Lipoprotein n=1 Tax=Sporolactobacillus kofuensis TaxID=269672 RepID=A0ABW1WBZ8_9BACL|nr:hypothetical protein [Sporolactobacillus kofuensis]MCO7175572.1 hypothetical protein [Sporolactobacillus kofuensis]